MQPVQTRRKHFSFNYSEKLHLQRDFKLVFKKGLKFDAKTVKVLAFKREGKQIRRLGLVASAKVGNAVQRNLAKRRLREIFRTNKNNMAQGLDLVFILKPKIASVKYNELQKAILDILTKAKLYSSLS
ncbi:MAG: ribonuclease P protein component [Elusimicrobiota bacterium]|jgi:ribonuclease P protein component|nr:ribonuclease P protein component [Elusimicrobiota bacterium]